MNKSDNINELVKSLVEFHKEVGTITKNANNPFFKSKYGDLNSYLAEIRDPLANNGLAIIQLPTDNGLTTILAHSSGQWISESMVMMPTKDDPQGRGSALTYMRRYSLAAVLNLNAEDDDGNKASRKLSEVELNEELLADLGKIKDIVTFAGDDKAKAKLRDDYYKRGLPKKLGTETIQRFVNDL